MLQSADIVFKGAAVSRVFGISERQGYASKAATVSSHSGRRKRLKDKFSAWHALIRRGLHDPDFLEFVR